MYSKRLDKIDELSKKIDYDNLKFIVSSSGLETDFSELKDHVSFLDSIKKREILIEDARYKQKEFDRNFKKLRIGNRSEEQRKTLASINLLFNGRNDTIKFVDNYRSMIFEVKRKAAEETTKGKIFKILTPKQMLQRLQIALAQVKAGNAYENLLHEIRQIIYSYILRICQKKLLKKSTTI